AGVFAITLTWLDVLLLGGLRGARDAAIYVAAARYVTVGFVFIQALQLIIAPMMSSLLHGGEHDRAGELYRTSTAWLVAVSWPIYFTLAVFAPLLVSAFGGQFGKGQDPLLILSMAALLVAATGPSQVTLLMGGKSVWTLANTVVALGVNIALNLV